MSKKALNVQDDSRCKGIQGNTSKSEIKCVCLNARSIINKKTELNIMVDDIKPHIIGITESWANNDITNAEFGLAGYVMFRKDRIGRRGGGVLVYISVVTIPNFAMRYVSRYLGHDAICIAILVYRVSQSLDFQFVYDGSAMYRPRYTLPNHHNRCRMCWSLAVA